LLSKHPPISCVHPNNEPSLNFTMMLNKQFLALALAAGASFLVGCEDDDAADAGKCAGEAFFQDPVVTATSDAECFNCLKGTGTTVPLLGLTAESIKVYTDCDVEFQYACKGVAEQTAGETANLAAAVGLLAGTEFSTDVAKQARQLATCTECLNAYGTVSTKTEQTEKVDEALETCGVSVKAAAV